MTRQTRSAPREPGGPRLTFLGATGTVTGSRYLVTTERATVLVDCGLFQGYKQLRLRNREPFAVDPRSIDAVLLTHAHLDHSGYLPVLVRDGFRGPVHCSGPTIDLCGLLLPDSGHLQEEEARYANRHGYSRHQPALPLYTREDAEDALRQLRETPFDEPIEVAPGVTATFQPAGHLIGAASIVLEVDGVRIFFSGDVGRPNDPLLPSPAPPQECDYLLVESTYGDRIHPAIDPLDQLEEIIKRTASRGGAVLIPSFAVGRAQQILLLLHRLRQARRIPQLPIYLDSPMAARAGRFLLEHADLYRLSPAECKTVMDLAKTVETPQESIAVGAMRVPRIIISASGMATGGRVLHHLKSLAPDPRNTILFSGFQAGGTRGASLVGGARSVKIHGAYIDVRADVETLEGMSGHADADELLDWLGALEQGPTESFVIHGEAAASDGFRRRVEERFGWRARVPEHRETVELQAGGRRGSEHGTAPAD